METRTKMTPRLTRRIRGTRTTRPTRRPRTTGSVVVEDARTPPGTSGPTVTTTETQATIALIWIKQGVVVVAVEDAVAAEIIKVAAAAVVATADTITTMATTKDLLKVAEANITTKDPLSITTIRGIKTKVDTKAIKASSIIKVPLKSKAAEEETVSIPVGETISTTLKWMLGPKGVPITK